MQPEQAQRIVSAYADVLAEFTATEIVRDVNSLPYTKGEIKSALLYALKVTHDLAMRGHLSSAYISLADFQELSDQQIHNLQKLNRLSGNAPTMTDEELLAAATKLSSLGGDEAALQGRVVAEAEALAMELKAAGF